ncbi:MAG: ABC transporter permease [Myxococcales bacterium]|nr:ABC transporter permease [Myxococcales bacterium]
MGYPLQLALRYMASKKGAFVSLGTAFAMLGVILGVAALSIVMSVTGGFKDQFREKVLGVNAHVLVLKYSIDFREYRDVMAKVEKVPGVTGVAPFIINPMMVTRGDRTATGVLLKGVDPDLMRKVLDLPKHMVKGSLDGLRRPGAKAPERASDANRENLFRPLDRDAGTEGFLDVLRREIDKDDQKAAALASAAPENAPVPGGPVGDVTPQGGFQSQLPTDDVPLPGLDDDPCSKEGVDERLPGIVIGRSLGVQLGADIGQCVQVTSPMIGFSFGASGARPAIAKQFRVVGMFEAGFDQYDSKLVYTDIFEAQAFYDQGDSVTGVEMKVATIDDAGTIARSIDALLGNSVYHTMDWMELNRGLFTALLIQQIAMSVVLALILVVAAFTVVATLIMVVLDKKKEIALLKALGASDAAVLRIFLYQGAIIGIVGTALGLILGYAACRLLLAYGFPLDPKVYFISHLPVNLRPTEFVITGCLAVGCCLIATAFPALYAARMRPSEGLRAE